MTEHKGWNKTAIECYLRGCRCKGCTYEKFFRKQVYKCKMKDAVRELVRMFGVPVKSKFETIKEN